MSQRITAETSRRRLLRRYDHHYDHDNLSRCCRRRSHSLIENENEYWMNRHDSHRNWMAKNSHCRLRTSYQPNESEFNSLEWPSDYHRSSSTVQSYDTRQIASFVIARSKHYKRSNSDVSFIHDTNYHKNQNKVFQLWQQNLKRNMAIARMTTKNNIEEENYEGGDQQRKGNNVIDRNVHYDHHHQHHPIMTGTKTRITRKNNHQMNKKIISTNSITIGNRTTTTNHRIRSTKQQHNSVHNSIVTLIPLSKHPMILMSSEPICNEIECQQLIHWFRQKEQLHQEEQQWDDDANSSGLLLFQRIQRQIDQLTFCPSYDSEMSYPRYITYEPQQQKQHEEVKLIPDGLHLDTNNGQLFRHVTVLLYLTTNDIMTTNQLGGATTFPLAKKLNPSYQPDNHKKDDCYPQHQILAINAATQLVDANVHYTKYLPSRSTNNNTIISNINAECRNNETTFSCVATVKENEMTLSSSVTTFKENEMTKLRKYSDL